ncbi:hypothetical protein EV207_11926 [Scopulibacillus darangshiensis]|uniref:Uncharacterized protein n=1 Tax=Scopulibacillus darangshiensis TaxID=442528 RepID=A0A4R2NYU9_9BACL|nr:hypothetical protein [Scopulibacillus darangshiensis]TCP26595.1 hypothetical protein EV207_11926 [Scopulibacillus darangshiensis]
MMQTAAEVFESNVFNYVYIYHLGFIDHSDTLEEVYSLSEKTMSDFEMEKNKRLMMKAYKKPVIQVKVERLNEV